MWWVPKYDIIGFYKHVQEKKCTLTHPEAEYHPKLERHQTLMKDANLMVCY